MSIRITLRFLLAAFFATGVAHAKDPKDPAELYRSGANAYEEGDFQAAHDTWLSIVDDRGIAADLFYNLGNASHRLGNTGEAALWYQRARVIDPSHAESAQNLKVLERQVGFLTLATNPIQKLVNSLTHRWLLIIATIAFWAFLLNLAFATVFPNGRLRSPSITVRALSLLVLVLALSALYVRRSPQASTTARSSSPPDSTARTAPADGSKEVIRLPPGTQVDRRAERASWSYVAIPGRTTRLDSLRRSRTPLAFQRLFSRLGLLAQHREDARAGDSQRNKRWSSFSLGRTSH